MENEKEMSLSKQRKLDRKEAIKKQKRNSVIGKIVAVVLILAVLGLIGWGVGSSIYKKANSVTASADFSAQINDDGTIKDVKASDIVTLCDYNNIKAPLSEVNFTDEEVDAEIKNELEGFKALDTETTAAVASGDTVSIDYAGTMDGVAFDGGTAEDYQLEIGSGNFIDGFEDQIIGHKVGDNFTVDVTFPDPYDNNPDLAGKPAAFDVTLKGIYVVPELTDEVVAEHFSENASTAEEYRAYVKESNMKAKLTEWLQNYLKDNCTVSSYPSAYTDQMKANYKYQDMSSYEYMNQLYTQYNGAPAYASFEEYVGVSESEYDASLGEKVEPSVKLNLICQAIAEKEGMTASIDDYKAYYLEHGGAEEDINTQIENYGTGYIVASFLGNKVMEFVQDKVTVE